MNEGLVLHQTESPEGVRSNEGHAGSQQRGRSPRFPTPPRVVLNTGEGVEAIIQDRARLEALKSQRTRIDHDTEKRKKEVEKVMKRKALLNIESSLELELKREDGGRVFQQIDDDGLAMVCKLPPPLSKS